MSGELAVLCREWHDGAGRSDACARVERDDGCVSDLQGLPAESPELLKQSIERLGVGGICAPLVGLASWVAELRKLGERARTWAATGDGKLPGAVIKVVAADERHRVTLGQQLAGEHCHEWRSHASGGVEGWERGRRDRAAMHNDRLAELWQRGGEAGVEGAVSELQDRVVEAIEQVLDRTKEARVEHNERLIESAV